MSDHVSTPNLHRALSTLSTEILASDHIFISGHFSLKSYVDEGIYRFGDRVFTTIRDPIDIIISHVNYVVTKLVEDSNRPDCKIWLKLMGESGVSPGLPWSDCIELARRVLYNSEITKENYLCTYLGAGSMESTFFPMAAANIEITSVTRYYEWRHTAWGMAESKHHNRSEPYLTRENISAADLEYIKRLTVEDRRLYDFISPKIDGSSAPSIRGLDLMQMSLDLISDRAAVETHDFALPKIEGSSTPFIQSLDLVQISVDLISDRPAVEGAGFYLAQG